MKIAAIMSSPNGMKGYTSILLKPLLAEAERLGAEVELFQLKDFKINFCKGCTKTCHKTGECHQKDDDFAKILGGMLDADGVVFATPNYMFSITAQLKALLDRCNFPLHCGKFFDKYAVSVVSAGGSDNEMVTDYLGNILTQFGFRIPGSVAGVEVQFEDEDERAELEKEATELGASLVNAIKNQETFEDREEGRLMGLEIMGFLVQEKQDMWPKAYEYWCDVRGFTAE